MNSDHYNDCSASCDKSGWNGHNGYNGYCASENNALWSTTMHNKCLGSPVIQSRNNKCVIVAHNSIWLLLHFQIIFVLEPHFEGANHSHWFSNSVGYSNVGIYNITMCLSSISSSMKIGLFPAEIMSLFHYVGSPIREMEFNARTCGGNAGKSKIVLTYE